ncbi:alkylation response protein AidB-like acyl-CoA dehydrogenase [Jatrophihabitans sp. GAS493]|uniref:acyl-CoA dehydrogenase family protein n=1 Tax=Jatrophihabitans sp. GAS493 TaxID=1907575 RepID=UPI000BB99364|nr:acyl-CoA dehydrogenase family protein [Jatrophihabitans sp. GAS493]SOD72031.1 alkylation response protein AidB-like acyl-CoA dehydrogenase [Jatrophihabitans sp. GAS493]
MKRNHYDEDHLAFGDSVRTFLQKEVVPHYLAWEEAEISPREVFTAAGKNGFLGMAVDEQYGGGGSNDFRFNQILAEEVANAGVTGTGLGITLHNDTCLPYFLTYANEEQRERWLPGIVSGDLITAVGMTEPGAGSDLAGIRTSAVRDGDHYIVNGAKTFITNGINADLVITVVRTSPDRHTGLSLLIVERGQEGFERGRNLNKIGLHSQDTAELSFTDVRVPVANLLGEEGKGFLQLVKKLPQERLSIAVSALAEARAAFNNTLAYVNERKAFGKSIGSFQNSKFVLAEIATELDVAQAFVDQSVVALNAGDLDAVDASKAKFYCTELQGRTIDKCLQLHGGYGYMLEYPIARAYADARVTRIYGGSSEIMKEVISRSLGI